MELEPARGYPVGCYRLPGTGNAEIVAQDDASAMGLIIDSNVDCQRIGN